MVKICDDGPHKFYLSYQTYFTFSVLNSLTEDIEKNNSISDFVFTQKAFDTVDHEIVLNNFKHYGICGIDNSLTNNILSGGTSYALHAIPVLLSK